MYNPGIWILLLFSTFLVWKVRAPGSIKDLMLSPALKPILANPHSMLLYRKNTNDDWPSATITTCNEFSWKGQKWNQKCFYYRDSSETCSGCLLEWLRLHTYLRTKLNLWKRPGTRSHVAIKRSVGVKFPLVGKDLWSCSRALCSKVGLDVCL